MTDDDNDDQARSWGLCDLWSLRPRIGGGGQSNARPERRTTMKLSEAIRLGAMLRPQGFGDLWVGGAIYNGAGGWTKREVRSCALGAAFDALGCGWSDPVGDPPKPIND